MGICGTSDLDKMHSNLKNSKLKKNEILINVIYNNNPYNDVILDKNKKIMDILDKINVDKEYDYDFFDSNNILINDKQNQSYEELFPGLNNITIYIQKYSLNIPTDIRYYIYNSNVLIGNISFNNSSYLIVFIYNIKLKQLFSYNYKFEKYPELTFINNFSTFCNANNSLYISGGESDNEGTNRFIKIELNKLEENKLIYKNLISLNYKRYWHSMIFIPEKYIFIVGGPNEEVEMYDIEKNEIYIDGKLNYKRFEPSLIFVNNKFLYCICGFQMNNNFLDTIERCNLLKRQRKWEIVNYQLANNENSNKILISFFGISYINNNIILIGDKENENVINPNYLLKCGEKDFDTIEDYGFINSKNTRTFTEKFFIPINKDESLALPFKLGEPKILILNNNTGEIKEIILKENNEKDELL